MWVTKSKVNPTPRAMCQSNSDQRKTDELDAVDIGLSCPARMTRTSVKIDLFFP